MILCPRGIYPRSETSRRRIQVGPWLHRLFLAPTAKASGRFHLSLAKRLQPVCCPSVGLESGPARCSVALRFALTRTRRVWEAPLGNEARLCTQGLSKIFRWAANGKQPGSRRRLTTCQLFSRALWCVTFFPFSSLNVARWFPFPLLLPFTSFPFLFCFYATELEVPILYFLIAFPLQKCAI